MKHTQLWFSLMFRPLFCFLNCATEHCIVLLVWDITLLYMLTCKTTPHNKSTRYFWYKHHNTPDMSKYALTWWCAERRTDGDFETGLTCWQVQQDNWCVGTYPDNAHNTAKNQFTRWVLTEFFSIKFCQKIYLCVSLFYPCPCHVELDGANDNQDEQTSKRDLCQWPLCVPWNVFQHLKDDKGTVVTRGCWKLYEWLTLEPESEDLFSSLPDVSCGMHNKVCLPTTSWMERLKASSSVRIRRIIRAM